jgi:hypothetical protein
MIKLELTQAQITVLYSFSISLSQRSDLDSLVVKLNSGNTELTKREFLPIYHYYMAEGSNGDIKQKLADAHLLHFGRMKNSKILE